MRDATCVVLAAGLASRMGREKLVLPFGDGTVLDAVLAACEGLPTVVVASERIIEARADARDDTRVVLNDEPERGMTHSLRLANRVVPENRALAVLLGDKPLVTQPLVRALLEIDDADVVFPVRNGVPGHPVVFGPRARARIDALPDGDTLHLLRDDPELTRRTVSMSDDGAFADVDTEEDYRRVTEAVRARASETK